MKQKDDFSSLFYDKLQKAELDVPADAWSGLLNELHTAASVKPERPTFYIGRSWWAVAASAAVLLGMAAWLWLSTESVHENASLAQVPTSVVPSVAAIPDEQPMKAAENEWLGRGIRPLSAARAADTYDASYTADTEEEMVEVTVTIQTQVYGTRQPAAGGYTVASHKTETAAYEEQVPATEPVSASRSKGSWSLAFNAGSAWPARQHQAPMAVGVMLKKELSGALALETGLRFTHYPEKDRDDVQTLSLPVQLDVSLAKAGRTRIYAAIGGVVEKTLGHGFKEDPLQLSARGGVGIEYQLSGRLVLYAEPAVDYRLTDGGRSDYLHTARQAGLEITGGLRMSF